MKPVDLGIWVCIALVFMRGLFVFDMGPSAANSYPVASAICFAGSVIAAAIMATRRTHHN